MAVQLRLYDREAAAAYAHRWAFGRNPQYYDYDRLGGDCTNFASQCLFAGCGIMNHTPTFGWYYYDANRKAPAWTGVEALYRFLTRSVLFPGPFAEKTAPEELQPGDIVQLSFDGIQFRHTLVVVSSGRLLLAAHSDNADLRPLETYSYKDSRFLHIIGAYSS